MDPKRKNKLVCEQRDGGADLVKNIFIDSGEGEHKTHYLIMFRAEAHRIGLGISTTSSHKLLGTRHQCPHELLPVFSSA